MTESTQLTTPMGYNVSRMIFSEPQGGSIPDSKPAISYKRITIQTKNDDGTVGDLILPTEELFSFGVSENISMDTGKVNGYVFPICLYNRDGATPGQKAWVETFNNIVEHTKKHLVENRESIEQWELGMSDLKKFNVLYYKRDKGKIVEGTGPTLYAKLIVSRKLNKIVSMFFDYAGDDVDPLQLIGKYCFTKVAIKIESIFIGNKISLQVKLYEAEVRLMDTGMKRLLAKPKVQTRVLTSKASVNPMFAPDKEAEAEAEAEDDVEVEPDADGDTGSIAGDDADEPTSKPVKKASAKKVVKRRVKKVVRKDADEE